MLLYSTNNKDNIVDLKTAVLDAFPKDKGLYMPCEIPVLKNNFFNSLSELSFCELSFAVCSKLFKGFIPEKNLEKIIYTSFDFDIPLVELDDNLSILELYHGPTLAFKDFGARFMANLMSFFLSNSNQKRTILVATSGDTGGAVAAGFYNTENINVIILYPSEKVSEMQEKQLTTWGSNIKAIEVLGSFDDCQSLVKEAFLDQDLSSCFQFSSANSINIARLISQSLYYFEAIKKTKNTINDISITIPSGNFGNLTAGLLAREMGLNIKQFIAANNSNNSFTNYIQTGEFLPKPSIQTISNAMDVGNPSNFPRIMNLYGSTWNIIKDIVKAHSISEQETTKYIQEYYTQHKYILDPHTAVGIAATMKNRNNYTNIVLATAHPAKFKETVETLINIDIEIPSELLKLLSKDKRSIRMSNNYEQFKELLMFDTCST